MTGKGVFGDYNLGILNHNKYCVELTKILTSITLIRCLYVQSN